MNPKQQKVQSAIGGLYVALGEAVTPTGGEPVDLPLASICMNAITNLVQHVPNTPTSAPAPATVIAPPGSVLNK